MIDDLIDVRVQTLLRRKYGNPWWPGIRRAGPLERRLRARYRRPIDRGILIAIPISFGITCPLALDALAGWVLR